MNFSGSQNFRSRIICSTLSGEPIEIHKIRRKTGGIAEHEQHFLDLICQITNGTIINISENGTSLSYTPGLITNCEHQIQFDCGSDKGIAWYVEGILPIIIFGKHEAYIILSGLLVDSESVSIDTIRASYIPLMKKFGIEQLNLKRQGSTVTLNVYPARKLTPLRLTDQGKVKRIRGIVYSSRINVQIVNRAGHACKGHLLAFTPDIWIHTDCLKGIQSHFMGLQLTAETDVGCVMTSDFVKGEESLIEDVDSEVPEDLGYLGSIALLDEIMAGGCVDSHTQWIALLLMAIAHGQSSIKIGRLTQSAIELLRIIKDLLRVKFIIEQVEDSEEVMFKCAGMGYENYARQVN